LWCDASCGLDGNGEEAEGLLGKIRSGVARARRDRMYERGLLCD